MKKLLSFFVLFFMGLLVFAQAPQKFSYQAVVRNESNTLVRGTVGVRVSILQGGVNGTIVYQETHTTTTNINGLMTLEIGGGAVLSGDFASIDWADGPYFLKTETDPNGGTNYTIEGTQQLLSVPYALYAGSAANSFSGSYNDLTDLPQIPDIPTNVSAFNNDAGYITMDSVPEIPTNVSAFVNDAGYVTESTLTTENYITQNDLITNNYVTSADIPTNVSAFANDAGYITANDVPAYQVLSISNDTIFLSNGGYAVLPAGFDGDYNSLTNRPTLFSGDYNDLTNQPQIPQVPTNVSAFTNDAGYVTESMLTTENYITQNDLITNNYITTADIPTNVSAFTNDAGYITMDSIPEIPTVPTNVSAFTNDAGYVTESMLTTENYITQNDLITNNYITTADIPTNVSAFTNDAGYITMDSIPEIPTVPTNVSAFTNDAGYVTESMLTTENYITQNDLITNNYVTEADIPTNVSAFTNDAGYITMDSVPAIPTNVSAFTNDAGYVTESMLTTENYITQNDLITNNYVTEADIPTNVSAFTNDAGYITMDSIPEIPTVPTNVSAFINDVGYLTSATVQEAANIPTNVSAFNNDAGYITMAAVPTVPTNVSAFTNDAGYLTSYTETDPQFNAWDKDYNDLINRPQIPEIPTNVSAFNNDAGYITMDAVPTVPTNVSAFTNDAGYVTESMLTTENYITQNDLITNNYITTADIPTNVSAFTNDAGYITMDSVPTIPTNVSAFTNDAGYVTESMLTTENYITQNDLITNNYITTADIPTNVSAFTNDAGYITMDSIPAIPTVPTQVSAFENDAHYLTSYTETDPQFNAWNKDYNDLINRPVIPTTTEELTNNSGFITSADVPAQVNADWNATSGAAQIMNKPTIPTVPTNVSAFTNDAGYITMDSIPAIPTVPTNVSSFTNDAGYITMDSIPAIPTVPTQVSAFENDAHYLTSYTEQQVLSISNDTIFLTGGSFAKLPAGFSGSYNDLTDVPENVSTFSNDAGYLTRDSLEDITTSTIQELLDRIAALEQQLTLPVLNTESASNINSTSALSGGTVVSSASAVTERGVCWNTIGAPTIADSHTSDGNGVGDFVSSLTSLTPATTYYVRAFAVNENGTGYGPQISFTTFDVPSMTTNYVNVTSATSATISCSVSDNHGAAVTVQGICWNTTGNPTTADNTINAEPGSANYDINMSGLTPATTYYVRAYATNSEGTGYGNVLDFVTSNEVPYVSTAAISSMNETSAICGGNVTSSNGSEVTARGVCWSTSQNPTIADAHTTDGSGIGSFTSSITGLPSGTTYYVRAYATNSTGTGYGEQCSFNTCTCGTITDRDGNTYNTVLIGSQCWMKENLKTTRYADGTGMSQGSSTTQSTTTAYWYYPNGSPSNKATYGLLYNWRAVMGNIAGSTSNVQGICPTGWHVPSDAEWTQLTSYVSSQSEYVCGSDNTHIAKALAGTTGWSSITYTCAVGNTPSQNNATGFSALPAGRFYSTYGFAFGGSAYFWSATATSSLYAYIRELQSGSAEVLRYANDKRYCFSVRCVRD